MTIATALVILAATVAACAVGLGLLVMGGNALLEGDVFAATGCALGLLITLTTFLTTIAALPPTP